MRDPGLLGDRFGSGSVIASQHPHFEAKRLELGNGFGGLGLQRVGDRDQAGPTPVQSDVHRRRAAPRQVLRLRDESVQVHGIAVHQCAVADQQLSPLDGGLDALPGNRLEAIHAGQLDRELAGAGDNRLPQGVLGADLGRRGQPQQVRFGDAVSGDDARDSGLATSQCARFVEHNGRELAGLFQRFAIADEDAVLGSFARADQDGGGRRQAQRARAGDDQDSDRGLQRQGKFRLRTKK